MRIDTLEDLQAQPEARAGETPQFEKPAKEAPAIRAAISVAQGSQLDPDKVARIRNIGRKLRLPDRVVANAYENAHREAIAQDLEKVPALAEWAAKSEFAAAYVSRDAGRTAAALQQLQDRHQALLEYRPELSPFRRFTKLLEEGTANVATSLDSALAGTARFFSHANLTDAEGNVIGEHEIPVLRDRAAKREADVRDYLENGPVPIKAQGALGEFVQDVIRQVPQLAVQAAVTLTSGGTAGMGFMGGQIAGNTYQNLISSGVNPDRALAAGAINAALQAPLEQVGLGKFLNIFKTAGAREVLKKALQGVVTEGGTEWAQEYVESGADIWGRLSGNEGAAVWWDRFWEGFEETTRRGLYSAAVMAPFGVFGGLGRAAAEHAKARRATEWAQKIQQNRDIIAQLSEDGLAPDIMADLLRNAGGASQVVGIDSVALLEQLDNGHDILFQLGFTREEVVQAAAIGHDLEVDLANLYSRLPLDGLARLITHVRENPDAPTAAEAAQVDRRIQQDAQRVQALFQSNIRANEEFEAEKTRLRTEATAAINASPNLLAQAQAHGGVNSYVANWLNVMERYAWRMGAENPAEVLRKFTASREYLEKRIAALSMRSKQNARAARAKAEPPQLGPNSGMPPIDETHGTPEDLSKVEAYNKQQGYRELYQDREIIVIDPSRLGVREDADIKQYRKAAERKYKAPDQHPTQLTAGNQELFQDDESSVENSINTAHDNVNIHIRGATFNHASREYLEARENALAVNGTLYQDKTGQTPEEALRDGNAAMDRVIAEQTDAIDAMWRQELGNISFIWGQPGEGKRFKKGFGVSHIIAHRNAQGLDGEAVARKMPEVIAFGEIYRKQGEGTKGERVFIGLDGYTAILSLYNYSGKQTWLLSGWIDAAGAQAEGYDSTNATNNEATLTRFNDGAADNSLVSQPAMVRKLNQTDKRGSIQIYPASETYLISLFDGANLSTLLHETGHFFFEEMRHMVETGAASDAIRKDYEILRGWLGAKEGETLTEDQREQAARGFEQYLMEGRAPAKGLESAFARFRRWLTNIYKSALRLNAPITDEVRGVFDRMLAAENEIESAARQQSLHTFTEQELDALGLTGDERAQFRNMAQEERDRAATRLVNDRNQNRGERRRRYIREAVKEVMQQRVYRARSDLSRTPLDLQALVDAFGDKAVRELRKKLPCIARKENGADPELFAAEHGYNSATELVQDILQSGSKKAAVEEIVRAKEAESDRRFSALQTFMDQDSIGSQLDMIGRKLADILGAEPLERKAFQVAAENMLAAMPMRKALSTNMFIGAMRRQMADFRARLLAGDREGALEANRRAMLNCELARQSQFINRDRDRLRSRVRSFLKSRPVNVDAKFAILTMLTNHGLAEMSDKIANGRGASTIGKWLNAARDNGFDLYLDADMAFSDTTSWRDMDAETFLRLTDAALQIMTVEQNQRKLLTARGKADLQEVADKIAASIFAHKETHAVHTVQEQPALVRGLKNLHAIHTKIESLCIALDGGKIGPAWEYIYRPITEAEDAQAARFKVVTKELKNIFAAYSRKELYGMGHKRELVQEIGESITHENRLAIALNMGNETNRARLRDGHSWTDEQIAACVKPLTARDWQFVQSVWDYLDTFKEASFSLQQEATGLRPKAVEPLPFTVQTADGQTVNLKGGYYPISYNSRLGYKAFQNEQRELDRQLFGGRNYGAAATRQGHLQERGSKGLQTPLRLELPVITDHVFNTVHDLCYRKAVLDVAKVIRHPTVRGAFESTVGPEMYRQLEPWLQDVASERQEQQHFLHRAARWARASTSIMQMGFKATTILMQPIGITQTMDVIGYGWTMRGLATVYKNPFKIGELYEETCRRSKFMENRISSFDREIRDITAQIKPSMGRFGWLQVLKDKAFVPMGMVQMGVDMPTWWGAYAKGLHENGGDEKSAALYADSIVRQAQGGGATKDLARVQRGSDLSKLFTMFYSYFNTFYNLGAKHIAELRKDPSPTGIMRAANAALLLWFVPVILSEYMAGRGPEKDREWWKWAGPLVLQYPFQAVVGVRDLASGIFGSYGYQLSPAQSAPSSFIKLADQIMKALEKDADWIKIGKAAAETTGYALGLPLKQAVISLGNLCEWWSGDDPEFYIRDLFFAKPKDRKHGG